MHRFIVEMLRNRKEIQRNPIPPCFFLFVARLPLFSVFYWNSNGDSIQTRKNNGRAWKPQNRFALVARVTNDDVIPATCPKKGPASCSRFILTVHVILFMRLPLRDHVFLRVYAVFCDRPPPPQIKRIDCKSTRWDWLGLHRVVDAACEMSGCCCRLQLRSRPYRHTLQGNLFNL